MRPNPPPIAAGLHFTQVLEIIKLKFLVPTLPHIVLHLVYKSSIVLLTLYALFMVSKSVVSFSAHMRLIIVM